MSELTKEDIEELRKGCRWVENGYSAVFDKKTSRLINNLLDTIEARDKRIEEIEATVVQYIKTFSHIHTTGQSEDKDICLACGLDLRNLIHARTL